MSRGLAYLNGLRALEAVIRNRSLIGAAEELHVTPAAVGQQIRQLESWLGIRLFERSRGRGTHLIPLPHAEAALADLSAGFSLVDRGLKKLQQFGGEQMLTVTTSPAFGARWLVSRLGSFLSANTDLEVRVDVSEKVADLRRGEADCAIRYGIGPWPGLNSQKLLSEELFPVAAPRLIATMPIGIAPKDLLEWPLIEDTSGRYMPDFPTWSRWFARYADVSQPTRPTMEFNLAATAIQAATDGAGIALVRSIAVDDDLRSGKLVRLFEHLPGLLSPASYWLLTPDTEPVKASIVKFMKWINEEVRYRTDKTMPESWLRSG